MRGEGCLVWNQLGCQNDRRGRCGRIISRATTKSPGPYLYGPRSGVFIEGVDSRDGNRPVATAVVSGSSAKMALRQLRVISYSRPIITRFYSSNVPAKAAPRGTMSNPLPSSSVDKTHPPIGSEYKSQGTAIGRTIRNIWKAGWKRAFWQIKEMNDTKVGTLIGVDR